jgi:geranylgeranyl diphosphate synthase type I
MIFKIKKRIEKELVKFVKDIDRFYSLNKISPIIFQNIKDFVLREGKRARPILFVIGYLGFTKKVAKNLYTSALAIELLHDFLLVHDDIIDKSGTRRGKPSMHAMLNNHFNKYKNLKFSGQDLAIIIGDIMYAMSIHAFLAIKEKMERKEMALRKFIMSAMLTGSGEFIELVYGLNNIEKITKADILRVYDYKTAYYTFSSPLSTGAILAGASKEQVDIIFKYGVFLGRAFQIKDDILSMFADERKIGKSVLTDLQESKKTIPLWYAYHNSCKSNKLLIRKILKKKSITRSDFLKIRQAMKEAGTLEFVRKEIKNLLDSAQNLLAKSGMKSYYRNILNKYVDRLLDI